MSEKAKKPEVEQKFIFLYGAIQDTQETIRFTDTKSGAIVVLATAIITAVLALLNEYISFYNCQSNFLKVVLLIGTVFFGICIFVAIYLSFKSINPSNNPNEHVVFGENGENNLGIVKYYLTGLSPKMRFLDYLKEKKDSKFSISVSDYYSSIMNATTTQLLLSLSYEFIKLSYIKDKKYKRTQCSLKWLALSFLLAVITVLLIIIIS